MQQEGGLWLITQKKSSVKLLLETYELFSK